MSGTHTGSCLCGAVTFEITGDFDKFFLCHCSRCRKFSGTAHASNLFSSDARITWLSGEDKVKPFEVPGTRFSKNFCAECGSPLPRQRGEGVMVPAGCLDTPVEIKPDAHIFFADRANWDEHLEDVETFDQRPG
ncbi:GFA family protein [Oricola nitratireducens]|uniref:GFA family protein n=1 Tax=Oricola nitratireducens TaxID=2775868 RepID=UPI001867CD51|nr:GFA family protein [Oricola nitratireducens]